MNDFPSCRRAWVRGLGALALGGLALAALPAAADTWPSKPIRLIVSFPPGNTADLVAREIGPLLSQRLGQPVVVDNRAGAGGIIGVDALAKAAPDGYTLGVSSLSPITILPAVRKKLPYDPVKQIVPVTLAARGPLFLMVRKDSPINSVADLVAQSRANPGRLTYGSLGPGTVSQMTTELFKAASGANLVEVNYKGSAQAMTDLIGGHIHVMFDGPATAVGQVAAGTLKSLGVTTLKRSVLLPDVPTLEESGVPGLKGFDTFGWIGVFAPAGVPREIVTRVQAELAQILQLPQVVQRLRTAGLDAADPNTPAQFGSFIQNDLERWTRLATDLKIVVND